MQTKQLRILSTLLLAFAVAQAGLGSGYLDGGRGLLIAHATNAFAVLVLTASCGFAQATTAAAVQALRTLRNAAGILTEQLAD